jgi:hypothetical protein
MVERAGDVDGQRVRRGLFVQPRDELVAAGEHVGYAVVLLKQRDRGQRGHHRHRGEPERTRDEEGSGRFAKHLGAENRRDRVTVADRLAPRREVRTNAVLLPAAGEGHPKSGADLVEDEHRVVLVADAPEPLCESRIHHLLVESGVVTERRDDDPGEVAVVLGDEFLDAGRSL